jgi:hypothetical protein
MRKLLVVASVGLALAAASAPPVLAQNFLMNSAETINRGNFKIAGYPVVLFGEGEADNSWGGAGRFGYGFTDNFDVEAKVGFFEGFNLYGVDAELWIVKGAIDVSLSVGGHLADVDAGSDSKAVDIAAMVSAHVTDRLELYGGLSLSFESLDDSDHDFTRTHLVPGIEYKIADNLDLLVEFGIGFGGDSPNYLAFGLAYYLR